LKSRLSSKPAVLAALAAAYFVVAKLSLHLALVNPSATAVWPPTGIALAALLVLGYRVWPAILVGAFLANVTTAGSIATSIGIGFGNTLEALVGAYLVNRFAGGRHAFERARNIFKFALLAALISTAVSATIGVTSLSLGGFASWSDFKPIWITWWLGDASGDLVVAPALLLWSMARPLRWNPRKSVETALVALSLVLVGAIVFTGPFAWATRNYPLEFVCLPILVWAAFRLGKREAATGILLLATIAIWGTLRGFGPFKRETPNESLLLLQCFLGVIAVTTTALAAVVAERRRVQESLALLESAVHNAAEGVVILSRENGKVRPRIAFVNEGFTRITGLTSAEVLGQSLEVLRASEHDRDLAETMRPALERGERFRTEARAVRGNGSTYAFELEVTPVPSDFGEPIHWVGLIRDVSERMAHLAALEHQALYDFLTGLPNRVLLQDRLNQAIQGAPRDGVPLALCLLDLDRFKEINDTLGHFAGDALLKQVGTRLRGVLRTVDTVARVGGDEFAVLLPTVGDEAGATRIAEKILSAVKEPFEVDGQSLEVSASIGIALFPEHGTDWATLMRSADVAMYVAKKASDGCALYSAREDSYSKSRLALIGELRAAIERGELRLAYQPQVNLKTGRVCGVEALVRWQHPEHGLILPDEFIPGAERTGAILPLSEWVLAAAVKQCQEWQADGLSVGIAVNISERVLRDPHLPEKIARLLAVSKLEPASLTLEITESGVMADPAHAVQILNRIRASGVRLAIDDFGSGHSSLVALKRLPVDEIKLDKSFVLELASDQSDATIVRATIELSHALGRTFVAEGVSNEATWNVLAALGCDVAQGNYISPPLSAAELMSWIEESRWSPAFLDPLRG
jgi:diguanylate cyclase (GGDEF)-like protein/PAS domain S-box-containing protein